VAGGLGYRVLNEFLTANRALLIDRCRIMVIGRSGAKATEHELAHGIPVFLDQLIKTLAIEQSTRPLQSRSVSGTSASGTVSEIGEMAALHGRDLHERGFTLEQVVRDYGDVCQAVTQLADETGASIKIDEFRTLNRCLDNAIAGAVTAYASQEAAGEIDKGYQAFNEKLGPLAHELRNHLQVAIHAVKAIKEGDVGLRGATGAVLDRSMRGMSNLIDRSLAEVRITSGLPPRLRVVRLADFLGDVIAAVSLDPLARECQFTVLPIDKDIEINIDAEMLASAVGNLLQNAFKFTKPLTEVRMHAYRMDDRVLITVEDHCGGLPQGMSQNLLVPFVQSGADRSGLGLGLDICRRSVQANGGQLRMQDKPGIGCAFTIELPQTRQSAES
jgi:signal transduction histidine kinase